MIEVSVVIPSYNRCDSLKVVLPALAKQTYPADRYELVLVDNGSTDETDQLIKDLKIPNLKFIKQANSGRSGARNRGIKEASGSIILFTDADIIADPNLISCHVAFHKEKDPCAVVGCEIQVDTLEEYEGVKNHQLKRRTLHKDDKKILPWYFFLTGNASVSKDALERAGMFDENFTGYGHEDIELGYRLQKLGLTICYNPNAINYHWHPVPFEEQCKKMHLAGISTVRFYNKHKDEEIRFRLGFTPLSMLFYGSFPLEGGIMDFCKQNKEKFPLCKDIILQRHYTEGIKEGLKTLGKK